MYNKKEKIEQLLQFAQTLKEYGFTVLIPNRNEPSTWIKIFKNGNFGSICCSYFSGFDFSTVHKPCKKAGTGYLIEKEAELTIDNANKTLINYPNWAHAAEIKEIRKYKTIEEFINNKMANWCNYQIL